MKLNKNLKIIVIIIILVVAASFFIANYQLGVSPYIEEGFQHFTVGNTLEYIHFKQTTAGRNSHFTLNNPAGELVIDKYFIEDAGTTAVSADIYLDMLGVWQGTFDTSAASGTWNLNVDPIQPSIITDSFSVEPAADVSYGDNVIATFSITNPATSPLNGEIAIIICNDPLNDGDCRFYLSWYETPERITLNIGDTYSDSVSFIISKNDDANNDGVIDGCLKCTFYPDKSGYPEGWVLSGEATGHFQLTIDLSDDTDGEITCHRCKPVGDGYTEPESREFERTECPTDWFEVQPPCNPPPNGDISLWVYITIAIIAVIGFLVFWFRPF